MRKGEKSEKDGKGIRWQRADDRGQRIVVISDWGFRSEDFKKGYVFRLPFTVHRLLFTVNQIEGQ